jgi:membrane protein DedA with SNARE-associated domain
MIGKIILYIVGRYYGRQAMDALCRFSMSPRTGVGKADRHFERWGAALLIVAEFIPGVRTLAPSAAGAEKIRPSLFLFCSALGAALWTGLYLGIGVVFRNQIDQVLAFLSRFGRVTLVVATAAIAAYLAARWWRRRRSFRRPA